MKKKWFAAIAAVTVAAATLFMLAGCDNTSDSVETTYTVTFDSAGGSTVAPQTVKSGEKAVEPKDPERTGYSFNGWQLSGKKFDFNQTITADITLTAAWTKNNGNEDVTYTVTFDSNGGSTVAPQTVKSGEKAVEPKDPAKGGYVFEGWYTASGWKFSFTTAITADITLIAKWEGVKNPSPDDHETDTGDGSNETPDTDMDDAGGGVSYYSVIFLDDNGSVLYEQKIEYGATVMEPPAIARDGYTFIGWYCDGNPFDFSSPVSSDITLRAMWEKNVDDPEEGNQDGYLTIKGGVVVSCDPAAEGYLIIPPYVTAIGENAFDGCSRLKVIEMQDGVMEIGEKAFRGCTSLNSIEIPASVTSIGDRAFEYCIELATVNFRGMAAQIAALELDAKGINTQSTAVMCNYGSANAGRLYFEDCLTILDGKVEKCDTTVKGYVIIPNSVRSIGYYAFDNCTELLGVVIPTSVSSFISLGAFDDASKISEISYMGTIADWTKIVEFSYGDSRNSVYESGKLYIDGRRANEITEITENDLSGVSTIKNFRWWSKLRSVSIPNNVTSIGAEAFYECFGLTSVELPNSVTYIDSYAFYNCTGLTSIDIPNSVTGIDRSAFGGCTGLTSIDIPNSVTSIGDSAFSSCTSLTSIDIPNSVTSIGGSAFSNCTSLTQITMHSATPPTFGYSILGVFYGVTATMYVPSGSREAYITVLTALGSYNPGITVVEQM